MVRALFEIKLVGVAAKNNPTDVGPAAAGEFHANESTTKCLREREMKSVIHEIGAAVSVLTICDAAFILGYFFALCLTKSAFARKIFEVTQLAERTAPSTFHRTNQNAGRTASLLAFHTTHFRLILKFSGLASQLDERVEYAKPRSPCWAAGNSDQWHRFYGNNSLRSDRLERRRELGVDSSRHWSCAHRCRCARYYPLASLGCAITHCGLWPTPNIARS